MSYCGSGSDFGKVSVPVLVLVLVPDPDNNLHSFSTTKIFGQNIAFLMSEAALLPRKLASHFYFYDGSGSGPGTVSSPVAVPLRQKVRFRFHNTGRSCQ